MFAAGVLAQRFVKAMSWKMDRYKAGRFTTRAMTCARMGMYFSFQCDAGALQ